MIWYCIRESRYTHYLSAEASMHQLGFLDFNTRLHRIDKAGDPLTKLNQAIDWEQFRPI